MGRIVGIAGLFAVAAGCLAAAGCAEQDSVRTYTVAKPRPIKHVAGDQAAMPAPAQAQRMLGAMILLPERAWFFKATGPQDAIGAKAEAFVALLRSVKFDAAGKPTWTLPEGWKQLPGNANRFATLLMGVSEPPQELSVSQLPKNDPDAPYILANVNRWRGQLNLPPMPASDVEKILSVTTADGKNAKVVELVGTGAAGSSPPMAAGHPPIPDGQSKPTDRPAATGGALPTFVAPSGWTSQPPSGSRRVAFTVNDGAQKLDITVQEFPAVAMMIDPLANANRWRREVGLGDVTEAEVVKIAKKMYVAAQPALYFEFLGPAEAKPRKGTLVAMFKHDSSMWFVKLSGDAALVERERAHMTAFLESLRFQPQGAPDGK